MNGQKSYPSIIEIKEKYITNDIIMKKAQHLVDNSMCLLTSRKTDSYRVTIEGHYKDFMVDILHTDGHLNYKCSCEASLSICSHAAAALLFLSAYLEEEKEQPIEEGQKYTKEEMIKRVLKERHEKAVKDDYELRLGDNIHGAHKLRSASGKTYEVSIRNFKTDEGYCSCPDFKTNKLGTCKHLIYTAEKLKKKYNLKRLIKKQDYPFTEIYLDPKYNYHITFYNSGEVSSDVSKLLSEYFKGKTKYIFPAEYKNILSFLREARQIKEFLIRPEVNEKIEKYFEQEVLKKISSDTAPDFSKIKVELFDYQKEGVIFSLFKSANIIADEMGLGKTIQAITTAVLKKEIYSFDRAFIICPASLKYQWKQEIEKFSYEKAVIIEGSRDERRDIYKKSEAYFLITNYEAVMRDITTIYNDPPDMIILDEAQRIKNYDTKTSHAVKAIPRKHALVITGTPLENRLLDLYSIMNFIDPEVLAPQWEFSMNHCYFDKSKKNKITGYHNLQKLHERLNKHIIRREKSEVLKQLPALQELTVPIELHPFQYDMHAGYAKSLAGYINKKHKTLYDMQRIQQILTSMRMVCDSSYLVDKESNYSPKLDELQNILLEKLDIINRKKKVIIFSEWKTMLKLIGRMLTSNNIGYTTLSGDVPVKKRGNLIEEFKNNPDCLVFLSTEAGGSGLNLQFTDTVINFDLPWNPAKKNQRIGRINRIGQKSDSITAINLVALHSIESRIADGIVLKQELFDAVLNDASITDEVDFSAKGRSTFIDQLKKLIQLDLPEKDKESHVEESVSAATITGQTSIFDADQAEEDVFIEETEKQEQSKPEQIEETLNSGLQFLNGVFKMATGKELLSEEQSISINKETGEVVMKFKLPGF